jgi:signal peptidase I
LVNPAAAHPPRLGRLGRWVGRCAWGTVLLVMAVLALVTVPNLLGYGTLVVKSGSMGRAVPVGSVVVGRRLDAADVRVGDVILVRRERDGGQVTPVLHRVVELERRAGQVVVRLKGDANPEPDSEQYVLRGRTMTPAYVVPGVGYAIGWVTHPVGWLTSIVLPGMVVGGLLGWSLLRHGPRPESARPGR